MGRLNCGCGGNAANYVEETAGLAKKYLANNYERILDRVFVSAEGCWVYDSSGRKYLDFVSCYSALNIGHGHPDIEQAIIEHAQCGLYAMPQAFLNPWTARCAEKICFRVCSRIF